VTSQFENHIRAISGLALGSAEVKVPSVMYNLVGAIPPLESIAKLERAKIHLYAKEPRPGRKVGHVNLLDPAPETELKMRALIKVD
jgi:5-(carboxyamino)imidazole ribonucleotide synthase